MADVLVKNRFDINLADIHDPKFELARVYHGMPHPQDPNFKLNWGSNFLHCVSIVRLNAVKDVFGDKVEFAPQPKMKEPLGVLVVASSASERMYGASDGLKQLERMIWIVNDIWKGFARVERNVARNAALSIHVSLAERNGDGVYMMVVGDPLKALLATVGNGEGLALEHRSGGLLVPAILDVYCHRPTTLPDGIYQDEERGLYFL